MTSLARLDARKIEARVAPRPSAAVLAFPAASTRPTLAWVLDPVTGQLLQSWTLSSAGHRS